MEHMLAAVMIAPYCISTRPVYPSTLTNFNLHENVQCRHFWRRHQNTQSSSPWIQLQSRRSPKLPEGHPESSDVSRCLTVKISAFPMIQLEFPRKSLVDLPVRHARLRELAYLTKLKAASMAFWNSLRKIAGKYSRCY